MPRDQAVSSDIGYDDTEEHEQIAAADTSSGNDYWGFPESTEGTPKPHILTDRVCIVSMIVLHRRIWTFRFAFVLIMLNIVRSPDV